MEKIEEITVIKRNHHIYCDNCNRYLGVSQEYDDGYYDPIAVGLNPILFYGIQYEPYKNQKFCDICHTKLENKIIKYLNKLTEDLKNDLGENKI